MKTLPRRISLPEQTAAILLEEIEAGQWTDWLPGEHELCEQLHVSRTTLRSALHQLRRAGAIECQQGRRRRIVHGGSSGVVKNNRVVLLMPEGGQASLFSAFLIDRLREHLVKAGFVLEIHVSAVPFRMRSAGEMQKLAKMLHPAAWVLMSSTEALQRWFARQNLPCVIAGSRYPGIKLPSVEIDYEAVCRHAAGRFLSLGHRRIVLLNPRSAAAGEMFTAAAFQETLVNAKVDATVVTHDGSSESICRQLDRLMALRNPPSALLVSRARHVVTVIGHLLRGGVRVPEDVSVISRDDEAYLQDVVPTVARYSINHQLFAAKLSRAVIEAVHAVSKAESQKVMAQFLPGESCGRNHRQEDSAVRPRSRQGSARETCLKNKQV